MDRYVEISETIGRLKEVAAGGYFLYITPNSYARVVPLRFVTDIPEACLILFIYLQAVRTVITPISHQNNRDT